MRNLISVSRLDDQKIHCHFGDHKHIIQCINDDVGLAIRRDMLHLLSKCNVVNEIHASDSVQETSKSTTKEKEMMEKLCRTCGTVVWVTFRGGG